jgi:hypothetical protein
VGLLTPTGRTILRAPARSPGPAKPSRHVERHTVEQKMVASHSFRRLQSESMPVAEDGQTHGLPGWFGPGVGNLSVDIVGRRIDWQSSPLRLPNTETAGKSRSTESAQRLGSHFPPLPSRSAYLRLYRYPMYSPGKGSVTGQPSRAVADVR